MIISFQVIPTRQGDRIYTLDDQGVLRVKQPQQIWREVPSTTELPEPHMADTRVITPLHDSSELYDKTSILDGYIL